MQESEKQARQNSVRDAHRDDWNTETHQKAVERIVRIGPVQHWMKGHQLEEPAEAKVNTNSCQCEVSALALCLHARARVYVCVCVCVCVCV